MQDEPNRGRLFPSISDEWSDETTLQVKKKVGNHLQYCIC